MKAREPATERGRRSATVLNRCTKLRVVAALAATFWSTTWPLIAQTNVALGEALDATNLVWAYRGPWRAQTNVTQDGVDAAETGPLRSGIVGETAWLETSVQGPGIVSFWWKAAAASDPSTYPDFSYSFSAGGVTRASASEESFHDGWQQVVTPISAGPTNSTILRWQFSTLGGCTDPAEGTAWLDLVSFTPLQPTVALARPTETNLTFLLTAPSDASCVIEQSTNLLLWEPLPGLGPVALRDGAATVQVPRPDSPRCFYRLMWVH
ncbi:MAG TPA: hypothetical protein VJA21_26665 [Verrucomicrobiae bacterium]